MTTQEIDFAATYTSLAEAADHGSRPEVVTILVCDNSLLRTGLRQILAGTPFIVAEGSIGSGATLLLEQGHEPALVIIEAGQNSTRRLSEAARLAKESFPKARVIALADQFDLGLVRLGLDAGVNGFCVTGADREVLIKSLELAMLGETVLPLGMMRSLLGNVAKRLLLKPKEGTEAESEPLDVRAHKLSVREEEVLNCLMTGESNKLIARRLDVTEATVKVHVKAVLRKLGAANRTQAAMWATEHLPPTQARASLIT